MGRNLRGAPRWEPGRLCLWSGQKVRFELGCGKVTWMTPWGPPTPFVTSRVHRPGLGQYKWRREGLWWSRSNIHIIWSLSTFGLDVHSEQLIITLRTQCDANLALLYHRHELSAVS